AWNDAVDTLETSCLVWSWLFFFFQAEDGIRDWSVTGVQTCALPIFEVRQRLVKQQQRRFDGDRARDGDALLLPAGEFVYRALARSEERRVGKEGRPRGAADQ